MAAASSAVVMQHHQRGSVRRTCGPPWGKGQVRTAPTGLARTAPYRGVHARAYPCARHAGTIYTPCGVYIQRGPAVYCACTRRYVRGRVHIYAACGVCARMRAPASARSLYPHTRCGARVARCRALPLQGGRATRVAPHGGAPAPHPPVVYIWVDTLLPCLLPALHPALLLL